MFCNLNQDNEIDAVMTADTLVPHSNLPGTYSYTHIWCCQKLYQYLYILNFCIITAFPNFIEKHNPCFNFLSAFWVLESTLQEYKITEISKCLN